MRSILPGSVVRNDLEFGSGLVSFDRSRYVGIAVGLDRCHLDSRPFPVRYPVEYVPDTADKDRHEFVKPGIRDKRLSQPDFYRKTGRRG